MFTKGKPEGSNPTATPVQKPASGEPSRSATTRPAAKAAPSIFSEDMRVKGSVISQGEIQIDGHIEGDVKATSLTIGDKGEILGEVVAETVIVRGKVKGSIRARKVQLASTSRVDGDITHTSLSIEASAVFEGQVKHSEDPLKAAPTSDM